jgi:2-polyprenyl-3-methyl-5-hydroxy-6-metoxy-1,4-benzoquinol methylase
MGLKRRLRTWLGSAAGTANSVQRPDHARLEYLENQVTQLQQQVRDLISKIGREAAEQIQTRGSFDYQWKNLPEGRFMIQDERFRKEVTGWITRFTSLPEDWFPGKAVLDAGCGQGRYTWGLCKLGATVSAFDISESGLGRTREHCREFSGTTIFRHNILEPLPAGRVYDLVWSFGVLHHTGDTHKAFRHVCAAVKPGGYLYLMLYGVPRDGQEGDYTAVNEYDRLRRKTRNKSAEEKIEVIRQEMAAGRLAACGEEHVHGYFDAISPSINDLYTFEEIQGWLIQAGFEDIRRTVDDRNHHVIARRKQT